MELYAKIRNDPLNMLVIRTNTRDDLCHNFPKHVPYYDKTEGYLDPCQTYKIELLVKKSQRLKTVNYFHKKLHLRCLTGF